MNVFLAVVRRDARLAVAGGGAPLSVAFFVIAVVMVPFGVGPELGILARVAGGVIWVAALLAVLLSLDRLFQQDFEDGSLDGLTLAPLPLELVVLAKCLAHWLTTSVPLVIAAPVLAVLLNMGGVGFTALVATLIVGTPALSLIGAIGAGLAVGLRRGNLLVSLLVLPLYVPVLIFGALGVDASLTGQDPTPHLLLLGAISLGAAVLAPWAAAAALRLNMT